MKLNELLGKIEILTNINLYKSSTECWDASKETLIEEDITIADFYGWRKELYAKYNDYEVIGILITSDNKMQITIYKDVRAKKIIDNLTFEEVEKYYDDNIKGCKNCKCNDGDYCPLALKHCCLLDVVGTKNERNNIDNTKQVGEYLKEVLEREIEVEEG